MDYKRVLIFHFTNGMSSREISETTDEENCYGKLDGIRRRLTTGYTVHIEKL